MLVLRRRVGEQVILDGTITITVEKIRGAAVVLSISAPSSVTILRAELLPSLENQEQMAKEAKSQKEKSMPRSDKYEELEKKNLGSATLLPNGDDAS